MKTPIVRDTDDLFQRESADAIKALNGTPILRGRLLTGVKLTTGTYRVPHGLSRPVIGFIVVDMTANTNVWRDATDVGSPQIFLPLISSVAATVSLWVF